MAIPGPAPKDPSKRQRQNKPAEFTELPAEGYTGEVPRLAGRGKMLVRTREWWDTWVRSPQASQFVATDWQRLQMLAVIVDGFYRTGSKELAAEIRLQEAKFGGTPEDRQKLRWRVVAAEPDESAVNSRRGRRVDPRADLRLVE